MVHEVVTIADVDGQAQAALRRAARNLHHELGGAVDPETIESLLATRYAQLATQARITKYLPLFAERFVRDSLRHRCRPASVTDPA